MMLSSFIVAVVVVGRFVRFLMQKCYYVLAVFRLVVVSRQ